MKLRPSNVLLIGAVLLAVSAGAATAINYHLAKTIKFGAAPGSREYFDYISFDPNSRRLYLSHGTEVLVVEQIPEKKKARFPA